MIEELTSVIAQFDTRSVQKNTMTIIIFFTEQEVVHFTHTHTLSLSPS